jgi:hypothetical protein
MHKGGFPGLTMLDSNICGRHLQAPVLETTEGCQRADAGPFPLPPRTRARGNPRKAAHLPRQGNGQLGEEQDWRCCRRARSPAH